MNKIKFFVILILAFAAIFNLSKTFVEIFGSSRRLGDARVELEELRKENEALKEELREVSTLDFIEKEARERLNFIFPDEKIVLVADENINGAGGGRSVLGSSKSEDPVYKQWLNLLFD